MGTDKNKNQVIWYVLHDVFRHVNIEIAESTTVLISSVVPLLCTH